jgi:hypothetical protein
VALTDDHLAAVGAYVARSDTIRVFAHRDRLFINVPGQGEAELHAGGRDEFFLLVDPTVSVHLIRDETSSRVTELELRIGRERLRAIRR